MMKSHNLGIVFPPSPIYASFHVSETAFVNPSSHAASLDVEMVDRFPFLCSQQAVGSLLPLIGNDNLANCVCHSLFSMYLENILALMRQIFKLDKSTDNINVHGRFSADAKCG